MATSSNPDYPAVCTVTQMAKKLALSRPRFYQLVAAGVFPPPAYCPSTRMPIYPLELQDICLTIRKTGIGFNHKCVRFYSPRRIARSRPEHAQLAAALRQMGLCATTVQIREAIRRLKLPGTGQKTTDPEVIRSLFLYLHGARQNGV